jgi:hypothetical protein
MSSTVRIAAKIREELSETNENSDTKQDGIKNRKARLKESLKKKWEKKVMHGQYIRSIDKRLIARKTRSSGCRRET